MPRRVLDATLILCPTNTNTNSITDKGRSSVSATSKARVGLTAIGGATAYIFVARPRLLSWGATNQESREPLPGDELVPDADLIATRAITIRASAERVWPWIAQLGQGRGGFYSYDFLENLIGADIHSADRIVPELQEIEVGDEVLLGPEFGYDVALLEQGRSLVLRGGFPMENIAAPYDSTWAFVLQAESDETTRLLVRERYEYKRWWAALVVEPTEAISWVMSQKMLRGIRDRAERPAHSVPGVSATTSGAHLRPFVQASRAGRLDLVDHVGAPGVRPAKRALAPSAGSIHGER